MYDSHEYIVSDISTKKFKDSEGDISLAVKATVKNLSDDSDVFIEIQGIDEDGFEMLSIELSGEVPVGESKVLTTREEYIDKKLLKQVAKWRKQ